MQFGDQFGLGGRAATKLVPKLHRRRQPRPVDPIDISNAVAWPAWDEARYVTSPPRSRLLIDELLIWVLVGVGGGCGGGGGPSDFDSGGLPVGDGG